MPIFDFQIEAHKLIRAAQGVHSKHYIAQRSYRAHEAGHQTSGDNPNLFPPMRTYPDQPPEMLSE